MTIVSLIKEPFGISGVATETRVFSFNSFMNATIYVPNGTKDKYKNTLGWKDFQKIVEETSNIVSLESNTILIHNQDSKLYFTSIPNGTQISVYSTSGFQAGSTKASGPSTSVATNLRCGEIAIIKIGTKVVKFVMK